MYNQKLINILLKVLAWLTAVGAVVFLISGFFVAAQDTADAVEAVGYFVGYEVTGLAMFAFFYVVLGVLYRVNNK